MANPKVIIIYKDKAHIRTLGSLGILIDHKEVRLIKDSHLFDDILILQENKGGESERKD